MSSIEFLASESSFIDVVKVYDYVMRTDTDAILFPRMFTWISDGGSAVGLGYQGDDFTKKRLEAIAAHMGLKHAGLHNMQSTFYLRASKVLEFSKMLNNLTTHFFMHEFQPSKCEEVRRAGKKCEWPDWHIGVSSLYATNLAANHLLGEPRVFGEHRFEKAQLSPKLDCDEGDVLARKVAQCHFCITKHSLLKGHFMRKHSLESFCTSSRP